jgi:hypothetical protein
MLLDSTTGQNANLFQVDRLVNFGPGEFFVTKFGACAASVLVHYQATPVKKRADPTDAGSART